MANSFVKQVNAKYCNELDFSDQRDFEDSMRGFICSIDGGVIPKNQGGKAFDFHETDFISGPCPDTVNPSLWRQSQLVRIAGLFELIPGQLYQFRGFDVANMSFIRGENGWLIIDTLCCMEAAAAGLKLLREKVANLPVTCIMLTHSHGDHIRGLEGVLEKKTTMVIPKDMFKMHFTEELLAGTAMGRRSFFQFGTELEHNSKGVLGCGVGTYFSMGQSTSSYDFDPNNLYEIGEDKTLTIDGVEIDFMYTPNSEAPTEMMMYFPKLKAICTAEEINRSIHNLYTLRGAVVRNGKDWSKYIDNLVARYSERVECSFGSHTWPTWGNKNIVEYYEKQRDMYKFIHDQTLRQANLGTTINELTEKVKLPKSLTSVYYNREYYGTVSHNTRAQYQMYLGFYDGNPANLNPLTPVKLGTKYVEAIGGEEMCISIAKESFEKGEYQWAITMLNNVVFKNPQNSEARNLLAEIYRQNGYMQESAVWRNIYLTGAFELEHPIQKQERTTNDVTSTYLLMKLSFNYLFDLMAVSMDPSIVEKVDAVINVVFKDTKESGSLILKNSVLNNRVHTDKHPTTSVTCKKDNLVGLIVKKIDKHEFLKLDTVEVEGCAEDLFTLFEAITIANPDFNIIEP
ncbi:hypothetical protein EIN_051520 [Entamoeba invadens IP1]|uniref:hypothetical protein n=1 Tax=Entamoeba invadens IP1 TaxID=370355 RepID=UPI0002C3F1E9|nr:hypothetical protein EIN_051520 [Entamoeba invadens IP1]ELP92987.1 hypothetical protein EIN_051520 [Entamoeba invadens IP1]|eukprot:XP_004259758.1 hypothetical protein EIN_051520 [Entamoeba invadens IP1]